LARWLPDGRLEYLGRIDQQIKLRGYRIEPGEIEARLLELPGVQGAAVILHHDAQGDPYLCAYAAGSRLPEPEELRSALQLVLPPYMVPAHIVPLAELPVTPSGKLDRRALPKPELQALDSTVPPRTAMEAALFRLWQEVLGREGLGIGDDFFRIGGHSLKAAMLVSRIHAQLQREVSLRDIFRCPTIESLARLLEEGTDSPYADIAAAPPQASYPVSSAQKRLYILQQLEGAELSYNMPGVLELAGGLDRARLEQALQALVRRHEALRTSFVLVDGEPRQRILPVEELQLELSYIHAEELWQNGSGEAGGRREAGQDMTYAAHKTAVSESTAGAAWEPGANTLPSDAPDASSKTSSQAAPDHSSPDRLSAPVQAYIRDFVRPFRLEEAPLVRAGLIELGPERHLLLIDMHHIVADGVTMELLAGDWMRLYEGEELTRLTLQYKDYACWQEEFLRSGRVRQQQRYWEAQLAGELTPLELPADRVRPAVRSFAGDRLRFELDAPLTEGLRQLAAETGSTMYMVLLALYTAWLSRLSGQEEVLVGTPVAGRPHSALEGIAGMFVNTLVIRTRPQYHAAFRDYLQEIRQTSLEALEHADVPFETLVESLQAQRDLSRNPLFDAMFAWQNMDKAGRQSPSLRMQPRPLESPAAKFDLTLYAEEGEGRIVCELEYSTALFRRDTIRRWTAGFLELARAFSANPGLPLTEAPLLSEAQQRDLIEVCSGSQPPYPTEGAPATLHGLFAERVKLTPERTALISGDASWTFSELDGLAARTAALLRRYGVKPGGTAAIMAERSPEMVASILGVLRTGAAYVPLDAGYPAERTAYLLEDSGAAVLLALTDPPAGLQLSVPVITWEQVLNEQPDLMPEAVPTDIYQPQHPAYLIYTSGSTGLPKGVVIRHDSAVNLLRAMQDRYPVGPEDRHLFKTAYTFDVSVAELFSGLLAGSALVILPPGQEKDPLAIARTMNQHGVTHVNFVPSMLRAFLEHTGSSGADALNRMKYVFSVGEAIPSELLREFYTVTRDVPIVNLYGPTEATIYATTGILPAHPASPNCFIGTPLNHMRAYVLNPSDCLQPAGVPGELHLAGIGTAAGYRNREELNRDRFVPDPFVPGGMMYRTGDLALLRPDGTLEYIGRTDHQVKIRGYRIELGEIESQLLRIDGIRQAVAAAQPDDRGDKVLCAYLAGDAVPDASVLRGKLSSHLPQYMVPAHFIRLDSLPLNANGKVDRKALPLPGAQSAAAEDYAPPRNDSEAMLVRLYQEVLRVEQVGIDDHFFWLGGDSIKALQVISRLHALGMNLMLKDLFEAPTVRGLAPHLTAAHHAADQGPVTGDIPLSPIQRWFFGQHLEEAHHYNQSVLLHASQGFDEAAVRIALQKLCAHHDALRTIFIPPAAEDGLWQQRNLGTDGDHFRLEVLHVEAHIEAHIEAQVEAQVEAHAEAGVLTPILRELQSGFRLTEGPLLQAGLLRGEKGDSLLLAIHHLVVDGVSWRIVVEDFLMAYRDAVRGESPAPFPPKTRSFQEFSRRLTGYAEEAQLHSELPYWLETVESVSGGLPYDHPLEEDLAGDEAFERVELPEEMTRNLLTDANRAYLTEINELLLSALGLAVSRWSGLPSVPVMLEGHGREDLWGDMDVSRTVGWFTSMYPVNLPVRPEGDNAMARVIVGVKEALRRIPDKGLGYGVLRWLHEPGGSHLQAAERKPEIGFNYLGQWDEDRLADYGISLVSVEPSAMTGARNARPFALEVTGSVIRGRLQLDLRYSAKRFRSESVRRLAALLQEALEETVSHCQHVEEPVQSLSDFQDQELTDDELESILTKIGTW
ncbi:amino acid adenylation domain-containing protein, partial [Paenibacillus sp. KR2-11]